MNENPTIEIPLVWVMWEVARVLKRAAELHAARFAVACGRTA